MKTIVVAGAKSGIGKSTLVGEIQLLLAGRCTSVKIGHGTPKNEVQNFFYSWGTSFEIIKKNHLDTEFLIIESNSICNELTPDLLLYLDNENRKESAELPRKNAHLKSGCIVNADQLELLATAMELPVSMIKKIAWLTGAHPEGVLGVVLGGGMSSRMGRDKALLPLGYSTLLANMVLTLTPFCDSIAYSTQKGRTTSIEGLQVIEDQQSGKGPLMGIYSALCNTLHRICIVTACDIPYVYAPLIKKMLTYSDEFDIVVPSFRPGTVEPLLGIYTKGCIDAIDCNLTNDRKLRVKDIFTHCKTKIVYEPNGLWYANLNTPFEYSEYLNNDTREYT